MRSIARSILIVYWLASCSGDPQGPAPQVPPPGSCDPGCSPEQVCSAGACIAPGPTLACGSAPFGDGLPASGVLHVHGGRAAGAPGDGSAARPFATIGEALAASRGAPGTTIAIADGTYDELLRIDRDVALRCRCAEKVRLAQPIEITATAADVTISISGCTIAPLAVGGAPLDLNAGPAADWGSCDSGPAAADGADGLRVAAASEHAVDLALHDSVVAGWCAGVRFNAASGSSSALCVARSRLYANRKGLEVLNAPLARLAGSAGPCSELPEAVAMVASRVDDNALAGVFTRQQARGIGLASNLIRGGGTLASATGDKLFGGAEAGFGVYLGDTSSAHLRDNRIADNQAIGIGLINAAAPAGDTTFAIEGNLLARNRGAGIALQQLQATQAVRLLRNLVEDTGAADAAGGDGILVTVEEGRSYDVQLEGNTVAGSARHGALLIGVGGTVGDNAIRDSGGFGLLLQQADALAVGRNALSGNGAGDVQRSSAENPLERYGVLPLPLP